MRTSEVAQLAGVNLQTVRFYERRGLLPVPRRLPSGYRDYGPEAVDLVRFVKWAQGLGFSLAEIDQLLDVALAGDLDSCQAGWTFVREKVADLERRIQDLRAMRESLLGLLEIYSQPRESWQWPSAGSAGRADDLVRAIRSRMAHR
ncbi:MerR family transcriptional regulator [Fodinicola feengrottensis]|uniref:HTH merR-type domain-containing protein n=1 Tax=Fodinicola feengrottensis TaxID=435914 RepID=A0ABN2IXU5_9ACTN|nr:MerR family transcriptional regulator [Fodinicola feengrottensis]